MSRAAGFGCRLIAILVGLEWTRELAHLFASAARASQQPHQQDYIEPLLWFLPGGLLLLFGAMSLIRSLTVEGKETDGADNGDSEHTDNPR